MRDQSGVAERAQGQRSVATAWALENLETLTREQVELSNRLLNLLSFASTEDSALVQLSGWLQELTGRRYRFDLYRLKSHAAGKIPEHLGDSFATWFELPPDQVRGAMVIDQQIMEDLVTGMFDQPYIYDRFPMDSNPYDWGLGLYVLMRMMEKLGALGLPPLMMGTEQFGGEELYGLLEVGQQTFVEIVFAAYSQTRRGLVRVLLPDRVIQALEAYGNSAPGRGQRRDFVRYGPFADLRLRFPVELGRVELAPGELRDLERGDVVFLAQHGLQLEGLADGQGEYGRLHLSARQFLPCELFEGVDGIWNLRLCSDNVQTQEESIVEHNVSEERTAYLAGNATAVVEVRVGQVVLSVSEMAQLQSGHVMVLNRDVARGVELVVDGRVIGSGELVNVEGTLGVRVQWMGVR